ncbi:hypothetical protein IFR05_008076 [Cadophora sp. M221]|nr:hypothetical protein IFR05_008076 [Cadophora sp. M221]
MAHSPHHNEEHHPQSNRLSLLKSPLINVKPVVPTYDPSQNYSQTGSWVPGGINDGAMHETPQFQRHEEATTIELFYDLFFVANLTTFTSLHKINEPSALRSYSGFFCLLWFTWCQVSLFDVRFVADSILERIAKACQFGVMIGLAVVGPRFNPADQYYSAFQTLAIILGFSRFVLSLQYLVVLFHVRNFKKSKTPMGLLSLLYLVASIIYFCTFFGFKPDASTKSYVYISWYIIAVIETALNIFVTSCWKVVSFKGTHLVQRMTLLTLIILGEGIIVICKSITSIVKNEKASAAWTLAAIGAVLSAVMIVYFLYMLYFDWYNHHHFGSVRSQIWAILHFPLHLTLVLMVEGASQFIVWRKLIEVMDRLENFFANAIVTWRDDPNTDFTDLQNSLNETVTAIFDDFPPTYTQTWIDVDNYLVVVGDMSTTDEETVAAVDNLFLTVQNSLFDTYGIKTPKSKEDAYSVSDPLTSSNKAEDVFKLVFVYFFLASGITLILMNTLRFISKRDRTKTDTLRMIFNFIVGVALCLIAATVNTNISHNFMRSSAVLPTVTVTLAVLLLVNHIHRFWGKHA